MTAQIVAFRVTEAALPMITIGFLITFASKQGKSRYYGAMLMALGLNFFGMTIMGDAMAPLRTHPPFLDFMQAMENPFLGILVPSARARFWSRLTFDLDMPVSSAMSRTESPARVSSITCARADLI